MKVLITGIAGFVGANLARRLVALGEEVHGLVRPTSKLWRLADLQGKLTLHTGDLLDRDGLATLLANIKPDRIYHLGTHGAYHYQADAQLVLRTIVEGAENLFAAAQAAGVGLVVSAGSSSEYGRKDHPMTESELVEPDSYYAVGKAAQAFLGQYWSKQKNLPVITLRLFSVYGPWEEPGRFTPTLISRALRDQDLLLVSPTTARDFVYVDDVVQAFVAASQNPGLGGEIFNIGTGIPYTIRDAVEIICRETKTTAEAKWGAYPARPFDSDRWVADVSKVNSQLGWRAEHTLEQGLQKTTAWLKEHLDFYATA